LSKQKTREIEKKMQNASRNWEGIQQDKKKKVEIGYEGRKGTKRRGETLNGKPGGVGKAGKRNQARMKRGTQETPKNKNQREAPEKEHGLPGSAYEKRKQKRSIHGSMREGVKAQMRARGKRSSPGGFMEMGGAKLKKAYSVRRSGKKMEKGANGSSTLEEDGNETTTRGYKTMSDGN